MDGGHVAATFLKGRLFLVRNDYDGALKCFELVTRERPNDATAYYFKALSLLGLGKRAPAEQALLKALDRKPTPIDARFMLAELYLQDRKKELAAGQLKHLMTTAPRDWRSNREAGPGRGPDCLRPRRTSRLPGRDVPGPTPERGLRP